MLLVVLVALAQAVSEESRFLYQRAFAWYRLFRHWSSLCWDDMLLPSSLDRRARGIVSKLQRTKTSGPGKTTRVLLVFVSDKAWLRTDLGFKRDYFLPLPNTALDGAQRR